MVKTNHKLLQEIAQNRIDQISSSLQSMKINGSWIQYVRLALRMSQKTLAEKSHITVSAVTQAEAREAEGKLNIKTIQKLANAMNSQFVYAIIPNEKFETIIENAISQKAKNILESTSTHMNLENQESKRKYSDRLESIKSDIRESGKIW